MIVDTYTHILPRELVAAMEAKGPKFGLVKRLMQVRELHDLDQRFRTMDAIGDYRQIVSLPNPPLEAIASPAEALDLARAANDGMAALVRRHPDRFPGFVAALPMHDPEATMAELERAIDKLDAWGVQIFTNINGRPLDAAEFRPIFDRMARYDLPIWLHPARTADTADYAAEKFSRFELWWLFGWPYETCLAMSRLVLAGLFDRHPGIKIITHHMGGGVPFFDTRIEDGMAVLGSRTKEEDCTGLLASLRRPLIDYFRMFHADTALFGQANGLACGIEFFGGGNVVFASDAPFGPIAATRDGVESLDLGAGGRNAIYRGNLERLVRRAIA
ncbi:MAG TPA: amidohydrolase family protein [Stellaceae bacterium]|nr:amidohydrolase family protein [Stellaceae bacterium]